MHLKYSNGGRICGAPEKMPVVGTPVPRGNGGPVADPVEAVQVVGFKGNCPQLHYGWRRCGTGTGHGTWISKYLDWATRPIRHVRLSSG